MIVLIITIIIHHFWFPSNLGPAQESRISNLVRWNAAVMVSDGNRRAPGVWSPGTPVEPRVRPGGLGEITGYDDSGQISSLPNPGIMVYFRETILKLPNYIQVIELW